MTYAHILHMTPRHATVCIVQPYTTVHTTTYNYSYTTMHVGDIDCFSSFTWLTAQPIASWI